VLVYALHVALWVLAHAPAERQHARILEGTIDDLSGARALKSRMPATDNEVEGVPLEPHRHGKRTGEEYVER
jgi:hypothetical protein